MSPVSGAGRRASAYVRLIAEDGKGITNGIITTTCVDVKATDTANWQDCNAPNDQDNLAVADALSIITGGVV